jgi:hypothetical protein
LANVPAPQGARYGRPSQQGYPPAGEPGGHGAGAQTAAGPHAGAGAQAGSGYQLGARQYQPAPRNYQPGSGAYPPASSGTPHDDGGWDTPTHTVAGAYQAGARPGVAERGVSSWLALLVLLGIAAIGGAVDLASGSQVRGGFNIGIVVASVVAIVLVRRSAMFPVVVAPPLVYFAASAVMLYARSGGLHDRKVLLDAAANWLVYGFPAIAGATAAVLIVAGVRMFSGR